MILLGIDLGTQSLKVAAVDATSLRLRATAAVPYPTFHPGPAAAEQNPEDWLAALAPAIAAALNQAGAMPADVLALAVTGQLDGCVGVDRAGEPLGRAMIWMDRRATDALGGIDGEMVRRRAGVVADPGHMAAKIRHMKRHAPGHRLARFHQPVSFLVEQLTGRAVMDHALASTSMVYGLESRAWDDDLLRAFAIEAAALPALDDAAALAGHLTARGAALCGLAQGLPVAVGTGDDFANPIGAGAVTPGTVVVCIGTAEVVGAIADRPVLDDAAMVETHGFPGGRYFIENPGWLSGGAILWACDLLGFADGEGLDIAAALVPPGSEGVVVLPTLSGAMTPRWLPEARGAIYGLAPMHGRGHLARATLEGIAFAMADVVDRLDALGVPTGRIRLAGGGARSRLWAQIRATVANRPVDLVAEVECAALGAAVLAGVACGALPSIEAGARLVNRVVETVQPVAADVPAYRAARARARRLFDHLDPLFKARWP
ncbi:xylulokinase [Oleomonas cavernae]|uniref:xylulokinase n=1 Tax=Oleomonas cavernae TaxID=2320859 RepID=UPI001313E274|nr:FGGY family carbohydrate kinase [Oleomonas cavernae]